MHDSADFPRVLHYSPFTQLSGANRSMLTLVRALAKRGPVFVLVSADNAVAQEARRTGAIVQCVYKGQDIPNTRFSLLQHLLRPYRSLRQAWALFRAARRHKVQIIHAHSAYANRFAWPVARFLGIKLVTHQRDIYREDYFHTGLGHAEAIIAISDAVLQSLPTKWHVRSRVIHNAVAMPNTVPPLLPEDRIPVIGAAGRCDDNKGIDLLVEAAVAILATHQAEFNVWGVSEEEANPVATRIYDVLRRCDPTIRQRIHLHPFRNDIEEFFRAVDVVVVPTRYREGFGRMAAEAMSYGRVVLASRVGGLPEVVRHGHSGLLFVPNDLKDLVAAITNVLADRELMIKLASAGREDAANRFGPAVHADSVAVVYREVLGQGQAEADQVPGVNSSRAGPST